MLGVFGRNKDKDKDIVKHYRNTFLSPSGKIVLAHMLTELGLFDQVLDTEAEKVRADYAKRILMLCGIWLPDNIENVIEYLFKVPVKEE